METEKRSTIILTAELTRRGLVSLWESGGGYSSTGEATIVCKENGEKPFAIYIRRRGHLSNSSHALIPVKEGYYVIESSQRRGDFIHKIYQILRTFKKDDKANIEVTTVNQYYQGEWDEDLPEFLAKAVEAAEAKAKSYHCRIPFYAIEKE